MKVPERLGRPVASDLDAASIETNEDYVRQQLEIEHLKAENLASHKENTGLRETARTNQVLIDDLQQARLQIEL